MQELNNGEQGDVALASGHNIVLTLTATISYPVPVQD